VICITGREDREDTVDVSRDGRFHPSTESTIVPQNLPSQQNTLLPFEPTIFPKLQVRFADFPYLLFALKTPEASNLEDLMRLSVRYGLKMNNNTLFFMEQQGCTFYDFERERSPESFPPGLLSL